MTKTRIEWATDSWNPIVGCSKCSPACDHCYAEKMAVRLAAMGQSRYKVVIDGKNWNGRLHFDHTTLDSVMHWKKPRRIFVTSMGDAFHESVPFHWIDQIFDMVRNCPLHTFIILTKRADRMLNYLASLEIDRFDVVYPNVWCGVTICNQQEANEKIPLLLQVPAAVRFVSIEPILGKIDLTTIKWVDTSYKGRGQCVLHFDALHNNHPDSPFNKQKLDWVICGGESGPGARPVQPDWVRSLRDQCKAHDVPFMFKQWGEFAPENAILDDGSPLHDSFRRNAVKHICDNGEYVYRVGKHRTTRTLDGVIHDEYPNRINY